MTWCNDDSSEENSIQRVISAPPPSISTKDKNNNIASKTQDAADDAGAGNEDHRDNNNPEMTCPSCGHQIQLQDKAGIHDLPGLPAGVKFDPTDQEILEHLEAKAAYHTHKPHPLIDEFIPTLEGENGICYTHPEKLPGVSKDGLIRHFFHRPSKAYTTGTRKRRKVHADAEGGETRWHKTGKTRPVFVAGAAKGYKKILVLYTNYGRQRKPEKTNWVMHQYHLGNNEEEKEGELVISKVFYQTQPRQCGSILKDVPMEGGAKPSRNSNQIGHIHHNINHNLVEFYNNPASFIGYDGGGGGNIRDSSSSGQLIPSLVVRQGDGSSFIRLATASASKGKILEKES